MEMGLSGERERLRLGIRGRKGRKKINMLSVPVQCVVSDNFYESTVIWIILLSGSKFGSF